MHFLKRRGSWHVWKYEGVLDYEKCINRRVELAIEGHERSTGLLGYLLPMIVNIGASKLAHFQYPLLC